MNGDEKTTVNLDSIELNLTTNMVCSNFNRLCILYLLKKSPGNELQAEKIASLAEWAVDTYIGPVLPTQGMVYEYCRRGLLPSNLERLKDLYLPRLQATLSALENQLSQASWSKPEGGFYVGLTLPQGNTIANLLARAGEAGLKLSDGRGFFSSPVDGNRFLRIPFCSVTPEDMEEAISRLVRIL